MVLVPKPEQAEVLSLRELYRMNLNRLQHVTLSSCWSADNFILPGRWIISLPETFWRAGAKSILACLWPVVDSFAVSFMRRFYERLAKLPRDEALRLTQVDCLKGNLPNCNGMEISSPIYWAGFQLLNLDTHMIEVPWCESHRFDVDDVDDSDLFIHLSGDQGSLQ
jgi:CHAT domain-containing protein